MVGGAGVASAAQQQASEGRGKHWAVKRLDAWRGLCISVCRSRLEKGKAREEGEREEREGKGRRMGMMST